MSSYKLSNSKNITQSKQFHEGLYLAKGHNTIKIVTAILGIVCTLAAVFISFFLYYRYLRHQPDRSVVDQEASVSSSTSYRKSTSSKTPLTTVQQEQFAIDFEASLYSLPRPVMQQSLLQKELIRNYGYGL